MLVTYGFMDVAVTPGVRAAQAELGVDHMWRDFRGDRKFDRFREDELAFIAERDTFYIATVSETGWPYVQHRGGPRGFLKAVDDRTLVFGDFRGNFQFLSLGNLSTNDRASLILMDYPRRRRLKILAHAEVIDAANDKELTELVTPLDGPRPERVFKLKLVAFDWNCPKYIVPRYTEDEIAHAIGPLRERIAQLSSLI
jgi:predicted pyridoxine 5'-phosphate oxidase superfamily flavin-nucleotide-binding protein